MTHVHPDIARLQWLCRRFSQQLDEIFDRVDWEGMTRQQCADYLAGWAPIRCEVDRFLAAFNTHAIQWASEGAS